MAQPFHAGAGERLVLLLPDGSRLPLKTSVTIGRGEASDVRIDDRTVSRVHARIILGASGATIADAGSRFGTRLSGRDLTRPTLLRSGAVIGLGDVTIRVEDAVDPVPPEVVEPVPPAAVEPVPPGVVKPAAPIGHRPELPSVAAATVRVPVDATKLGLRRIPVPAGPGEEQRPRIRSGWALKRLGADEGEERFVLQDLRTRKFLRMDPADAALFELMDGARTVSQLLADAEKCLGPAGPGRLGRLVAELADRGLLAGVEPAPKVAPRASRVRRLLRPREYTVTWVGRYFERAYHDWGRTFFIPLSVTFLAVFALGGFAAFAYLVGARYGTPFVVARRVTIGGAVFVAGRFALVAAHELAHGLALAHYRRRVPRGGVRLLLVFPYAFVDTSEAYFESRSRRIVISAAGPVSDLSLGAAFSVACAICPRGPVRDVLFQLAFGAYLGAFFNLNPFLDRDGYNILVDVLREPRLRQRARRHLALRISGADEREDASGVLGRYAVAGVIWSLVGTGFAVALSSRYSERLGSLLPHGVTRALFLSLYVVLFLPVLVQLGVPALQRARFGSKEVNRVLG